MADEPLSARITAFIGIGLAIIVVTTVRGGAAFGYLMGFLFVALGVGRLYLLRRRR